VEIRNYRAADRDAVGDICVRTGADGDDARDLHPDPDLLPTIFAWPYVEYQPELAFVLDDGGRAVGYVLGCTDTAAFAAWFARVWLPLLVERFPPIEGPPVTPTEEMRRLLHHPERMVRPELATHPAHLHIDLLPEAQGRGYGRALMEAFLTALGRGGVSSVHLSMSRTNTRARAFYDRLGFTELTVAGAEEEDYLVRPTIPGPDEPVVPLR
jgi:ribosomal protein S18 acetylase RimI-like enzyme